MTPLIPDIAGAATMHSQHSANSLPSSLTPRYLEKQKYSFSYMHRPVRWTSSATELNLATPIIHPNPIRTMEDPGGECRCSDLTCIAKID